MAKQGIEESLEDLIAVIESKIRSFYLNYEYRNYRECVSSLNFIIEGLARYILARKGYYPTTHEGVQILIAQHFVKPKALDKNFYNSLTNLYLRRKDADYRGFVSFGKEDVDNYLGWVRKAYKEAEKFIQEKHRPVLRDLLKTESFKKSCSKARKP